MGAPCVGNFTRPAISVTFIESLDEVQLRYILLLDFKVCRHASFAESQRQGGENTSSRSGS